VDHALTGRNSSTRNGFAGQIVTDHTVNVAYVQGEKRRKREHEYDSNCEYQPTH
jgi:hypothetical protein